MYRVIFNQTEQKWMAEKMTKIEAEGYRGKTFANLSDADEKARSYNEGTTLECKDCKKPFAITAEEAVWYAQHNYNQPKRCPRCRAKRRAQLEKASQVKELTGEGN